MINFIDNFVVKEFNLTNYLNTDKTTTLFCFNSRGLLGVDYGNMVDMELRKNIKHVSIKLCDGSNGPG